MKWKILGVLGAMVFSSLYFNVQPVAADGCDKELLGFKAWYNGVCETKDGNVEIKKFCTKDETGTQCESGMPINSFVWTIVLNVMFDVSLAAGYVAIAMVIYGGYMYMLSQGDPGKTAKAKSTLSSAIVGMVMTLGASVIVNTFKLILGISGDDWRQYSSGLKAENVQNVFNWAYMAAGMVAVVLIIKNGMDFMLSTGDAAKVRKAQMGLLASVIGLLIIVFASVITAFVISTLGKATGA